MSATNGKSHHNICATFYFKVVGCVTDNASDYGSAIRRYGISVEDHYQNDSDDEDVDGYNVEFVPIDDAALPNHYRCASHTLSRVATKDAENALTITMYATRFNQAFAKLNSLCKKFNRPKSSEIIKAILGSSLIMPCKSRWNSLYDSIKRLLEFDVKLLKKTTHALSLDDFSVVDFEFFKEYVLVMNPIAQAIDSLQSDTFYSYFLPTITNIKYCLEPMGAESNLKHCSALLDAITDGFNKRFGHFFDLADDRTMAP